MPLSLPATAGKDKKAGKSGMGWVTAALVGLLGKRREPLEKKKRTLHG